MMESGQKFRRKSNAAFVDILAKECHTPKFVKSHYILPNEPQAKAFYEGTIAKVDHLFQLIVCDKGFFHRFSNIELI